MLKASIDIGSNTTLLLIGDFNGQSVTELESRSTVTALGKNLDVHKEFTQESMQATRRTLLDYLKIIKKYEIPVEQVVVTATEASRVAQNADDFYQEIYRDTGFDVQLISSEGEAYYTAMGVCLNLEVSPDENSEVVLMDVGGASTELIRVKTRPFKYLNSLSLPVGSVRATSWKNSQCFDEKMSAIFQEFKSFLDYQTQKLICVAGTMTALAGMIKGLSHFESKKINGQEILFSDFDEFIQKIKNDSDEKLLQHYPFLGKRAQSIVGGSWVAREICEKLGVESLAISTQGLRHGTLMAENGVEKRFLVRGH